jgi:hypothetical protein
MKVRLLAGAAVLALVIPVTTAMAQSGDKATGGGQVLFDDQLSGPGDTIGFSAIALAPGNSAAKGQVQIIDRTGAISGSSEGTGKFHGIVQCLVVEGNMAYISGVDRDARTEVFELYVQDNGEGQSGGNDAIVFRQREQDEPGNPAPGQQEGDEPCGVENVDNDDFRLARGNAQVSDGD